MKGKQNSTVNKLVSAFVLWCMVVGSAMTVVIPMAGSSSIDGPVPLEVIPDLINGSTTFTIDSWGVNDLDHSITVTESSTLEIIDSTLNFRCTDTTHYTLTIEDNSTLILRNSTITTAADLVPQWDPTFTLTVRDSTLEMEDQSVLAFPGLLTVTNTTVEISDSWITSVWPDARTSMADDFPSYGDAVDDNWWVGTGVDLEDTNDDGPIIVFQDCANITIADSRIDEVPEDENFPDPVPFQETFIPSSTLDGLDDVTDLWYEDGNLYTIPLTPPPEQQLITGGFDTPGYTDADYNIIDVDLHVVYRTSLNGVSGYNGTDYVRWEDGAPADLFMLVNISTSSQNTVNLAPIPTLAEINILNITFENTEADGDVDDNVYFDLIEVIVTLEPIYNYYPTMITLDNSSASVINTYVSVDWASFNDAFQTKNAFDLMNGANLYMYDISLDDGVDDFLEIPDGDDPADYVPFRADATSEIYNFKWLWVPVIDRYNAAVENANVSVMSRANVTYLNLTTYINDLGNLTVYNITGNLSLIAAKQRILDYMGKTNVTYNRTDASGYVFLPLLSEFINSTNYAQGYHVGEYDVNVFFQLNATDNYTGMTSASFDPFPNQQPENNLEISDPVMLSDLELARDEFSLGLVVNDNDVEALDANGGDLSDYCFILVEDFGQLTISNANLMIQNLDSMPFEIRVRNNGILTIEDSLITTDGMAMTIYLEDNANLTITDSVSSLYVDYMAGGSVELNFYRSTIAGELSVPDSMAGVSLIAEDVLFSKSIAQFAGTSVAHMKACSSSSPNFYISPTDDAEVYIYRRVNVNVLDGMDNPLQGATVSLDNIFGTSLDPANVMTGADGMASVIAMSDKLTAPIFPHTDTTKKWVGGYDVTVTFPGGYSNTSFAGLAAYDDMSTSDAELELEVKLSQVLPDLDPPLYATPDDPGRGDEVRINATVYNHGASTAYNVLVWINDTFEGETDIIRTFNIPSLAANGGPYEIDFNYSWADADDLGVHTISIDVDPNDVIMEQDETNNKNSTLVTVGPRPDLAFLHASDIWFSAPYPNVVVNAAFTVYADVYNEGDIAANDIDIEFYYSNVSVGPWTIFGNDTIGNLTANTYTTAEADLPDGLDPSGRYWILVEIDRNDDIDEVNETNNNLTRWLDISPRSDLYPDLIQFIEDGSVVTETWNRTEITIRARVWNSGGITETNVRVDFWDGLTVIGSDVIPAIISGQFEYAELDWLALIDTPGSLSDVHSITAEVDMGSFEPPNGGQPNTLTEDITINEDRPDLEILSANILEYTDLPENTDFTLNVTVENGGVNSATNLTVVVYDYGITRDNLLGSLELDDLDGGETVTVEIDCIGVPGLGLHNFTIIVDPEVDLNDTVSFNGITFNKTGANEELDESNNIEVLPVTVVLPDLMIIINIPGPLAESNAIEIGTRDIIDVAGTVVRTDNPTLGVSGIDLTIVIDEVTGSTITITSVAGGSFTAGITPPIDPAVYTVRVSATGASDATQQFEMIEPVNSVWQQYWWLFLIIIILVIAIILGITLYLYFVGLGKTVQCGECSAYIPEGATRCPKCGVEFETEVAKCSVCNAWVPIDVKNCPECGTEFTVGMEDLEDYETKMKRQYDGVVGKFRQEAKKELGEKITETQFQAWWAKQPTFITFDQWLKEEEEMKRMGSKPCQFCGTENSVTAKICHKCGTLMAAEEEEPPKKPPVKKEPAKPEPVKEEAPKETAAPPAAAPAAAPPAAAAPVAAAPVAKPAEKPAAPAEKKKCPSCGMEVGVTEKSCPICNYNFEGKPPEEKPPEQPGGAAPVRRVVRKPVKKVVRRPGEPGR